MQTAKPAGFQAYVSGFQFCRYRFFINHLPFIYLVEIFLIIIPAKQKINSWGEAPTI